MKFSNDTNILGKNTSQALMSGFNIGYKLMIESYLKLIKTTYKRNFKVIFTGGYAELFKTSIIRPFKIDKNITINGIIEIFKTNKNYFI